MAAAMTRENIYQDRRMGHDIKCPKSSTYTTAHANAMIQTTVAVKLSWLTRMDDA